MDFPPDIEIPVPDECGFSGTVENDEDDEISTLSPGSYDNIPPKGAKEDNIFLEPGNYCVDDLNVSSKVNLMGEDVFIYIKPGGAFSYSGGTIELKAPDDGD